MQDKDSQLFHNLKRLTQAREFKLYLRNTAWLFVEKITRMIVGITIGIWVARYLGPELFGVLSFALSFVAMFSILATFGLDGIVIRELVKKPEKESVLLGTAFGIKITGSFLIFFLLVLLTNLIGLLDEGSLLIIIIGSSVLFQTFNVIDFYFQSCVLSKFVVWANTISLLISSFLKIFLIISEAPLIAFAILVLFDSIVVAAGFIYFYLKREGSIRNWRFDFNLAKQLFSDSWPLIPHKFAFVIIANIDQLMLGMMMSKHAVGIYAMANKIIVIFYSFSTIFVNSVFPALVKDSKQGGKKFVQLYRFMIFLALMIVLAYFLLGQFLVTHLFGEEYRGSVTILNIMIFSLVFMFISVSSGKWLVVENYTKLFMFRSVSGALINIGLNYILILNYGVVGAAYASLVTAFYIAYLSNYFHKSTWVNLRYIHRSITGFH